VRLAYQHHAGPERHYHHQGKVVEIGDYRSLPGRFGGARRRRQDPSC
jgi:hypothetical protein